jgi:NAD(P)-dependent dehydrogenase (short-subunit alcohol dehydrogenase family)
MSTPDGARVLITGGTSGIGRACVAGLTARGARVVFTGRDERRGDEVAAETGGTFVAADASDEGAIRRSVDAAAEALGGLDALVCAAGVTIDAGLTETTLDDWRALMDVNVTAPYLYSVACLPLLRVAGGGSIVHIASIDASSGDGPYASYNASKAGLLGLSRTMALELGPHGVRVNCVSPGFTHTEMTEVGVPPGTMDYLLTRFDRVPMRRLVRPEEVAAACAFLASDDASAITGIDLTVDCGLTANWYILESIPSDG